MLEEFLENLQAREVDPVKIQVLICGIWDPYLKTQVENGTVGDLSSKIKMA